jgi:hypothetical protein
MKILQSSAQEEDSVRRDEILQQLFTELSYKVEPTVKGTNMEVTTKDLHHF